MRAAILSKTTALPVTLSWKYAFRSLYPSDPTSERRARNNTMHKKAQRRQI